MHRKDTTYILYNKIIFKLFFKKKCFYLIMEALTFAEIYYEKRKLPHPSVAFIMEIARKWINGENIPDINCQNIIAEHLGKPREVLFPPQQDKKKQTT